MIRIVFLVTTIATTLNATATRTAYSIYFNDSKIGYLLTTRKELNDTVISTLNMYTRIQRGKQGPEMVNRTEFTAFESSRGKLYSFVSNSSDNDLKRSYHGEVTLGDSLHIKEESAYGKKQYRIPWGDTVLLLEGIRLNYESTSPVPGKTYSYTTLSLATMELQSVTRTVFSKEFIRIGNNPDSLYKIKSFIRTANHTSRQISYVTDTWIERKIIQFQGNMEIRMIECPVDSAEGGISEYDVISATATDAPISLQNVRYASSATYRLSFPRALRLPSSSEQKIRVINDSVTEVTVSRMYIRPEIQYPLVDIPREKDTYLKPSKYIESDDSLIQSMARLAVRKTKRVRWALNRIRRYVQFNVYPSMSTGYATAMETAQRKEGDCTEFALLTTALCRAAHIPARVVTGIVYVPFTGSFYYHAWTQAFVDGKWVSIDAALRKFDPGHIALSYSTDGAPDVKSTDFIGAIEILSADTQ